MRDLPKDWEIESESGRKGERFSESKNLQTQVLGERPRMLEQDCEAREELNARTYQETERLIHKAQREFAN